MNQNHSTNWNDLERAAELLRHYADIIRNCHSSELERFDYLPEVEDAAEAVAKTVAALSKNPNESSDSSSSTPQESKNLTTVRNWWVQCRGCKRQTDTKHLWRCQWCGAAVASMYDNP
jgi:hypothetical protein